MSGKASEGRRREETVGQSGGVGARRGASESGAKARQGVAIAWRSGKRETRLPIRRRCAVARTTVENSHANTMLGQGRAGEGDLGDVMNRCMGIDAKGRGRKGEREERKTKRSSGGHEREV